MGTFWETHHKSAGEGEAAPSPAPMATDERQLTDALKRRMVDLMTGPYHLTLDEMLIQLPSFYRAEALEFLRAEMHKRQRDPNETYIQRDERCEREAKAAQKRGQQQRVQRKLAPYRWQSLHMRAKEILGPLALQAKSRLEAKRAGRGNAETTAEETGLTPPNLKQSAESD